MYRNDHFRKQLDNVHAQWFADEASSEPDEEEMDETELNYYKKFQAKQFSKTDQGDDVEVLVEGVDEIPDSADETDESGDAGSDPATTMMEFFKNLQSQGEQKDQKIEDGFSKLAQALEKQQQGTQQQQQPSWEQLRQQFNSNFYEDPATQTMTMMQYAINQMVGPAYQEQQKKLSKVQKDFTKQQAKEDPTKKYVVENYWSEVEEVADQAGATGDAYQEAIDRVAAKHLSEIVSHLAQAQASKPASNKQPNLSGGKQQTTKRKQPKKLQLTAQGKQLADKRGVDYEHAARAWRENTKLVKEL